MKKFREVFRLNTYKIFLAVLLIGIGAGLASFSLHFLVHKGAHFFRTTDAFTVRTFFISLGLAIGSYLLTKLYFKDTNGSGIPMVKLSLTALKGRMPRRMPFGKFLTTLFTLSSGLSFGKEGPMVTIAASWGHLVAKFLGVSRDMTKVLVSSGATAGLAAAFNTPIAAVVFTIEEILGELNTKYLGPIIVTSVIASVTSYELLGNKTTFLAVHYQFTTRWHLLLYILLGLVMSLVGHFWTKLIILFKDIKSKFLKKLDIIFIIFAVALTAIASQYNAEILGDGVETINRLLDGSENLAIAAVAILFIFKFALSATAYSSGLSGGLFMPVLFLGATGGALFGLILQALGIPGLEIGVFALLGMTSLLVAVIRTPFTAFVMLFEMTRDYDLILPLMASSIAAYWISSFMNDESVYETVAEYEGVHLPSHKDNETLNEMTVEECMVKDVMTLECDETLEMMAPIVESCQYSGFPVLRGNRVVGVIKRHDFLKSLADEPKSRVGAVSSNFLIPIYPDQSLVIALDKMKKFELGRLLVVSRFNDRELLGIITPEDIVNYLGLSKKEEKDKINE